MYWILKSDLGGPKHYTEHCYSGQVEVYEKYAIINKEILLGQLKQSSDFYIIGTADTQEGADTLLTEHKRGILDEAERIRLQKEEEQRIAESAHLNPGPPSVPEGRPRSKLERVLSDARDDGKDIPWFGSEISIKRVAR